MNVTVIFDSSRVNVDMTPVTFSVMPAKGDKGEDGEPGADGAPGRDGTIENLSVASETLTPGATPTVSYEDNTITFGQSAGVGISSYTEYYARSTSSTTAPADADFSTTPPELTSTYKYMWAYTVIAYNNNTSTTTAKHLIGVRGDDGSGGGGGTWGSITGTLSNQLDLYDALDAKADESDVYTKAQVDAKVAKPVPMTLTLSSWSTSTWSTAAVDAGAPSGGACYVATYSTNSVTLYNRFIPQNAAGYPGVVYVTCLSNSIRVETSAQPASGSSLAGVVVDTDAYVSDGVSTKFTPDALVGTEVTLTSTTTGSFAGSFARKIGDSVYGYIRYVMPSGSFINCIGVFLTVGTISVAPSENIVLASATGDGRIALTQISSAGDVKLYMASGNQPSSIQCVIAYKLA